MSNVFEEIILDAAKRCLTMKNINKSKKKVNKWYDEDLYVKRRVAKAKSRAGSRLPCVVGAQPGEGSRGPPRPLVDQGQSPGRGFRRQSPRRKTIFSVLEWLGRLSLALFC